MLFWKQALGYQEGGLLAHPGYTPELVLPGSLAIYMIYRDALPTYFILLF